MGKKVGSEARKPCDFEIRNQRWGGGTRLQGRLPVVVLARHG